MVTYQQLSLTSYANYPGVLKQSHQFSYQSIKFN
jgi:hypothetical protein